MRLTIRSVATCTLVMHALGCGSNTAEDEGALSLRDGSEDEPASPDSESSDPICESGETRRCVGAGACDGGQRCYPDGQWGECDCGSPDANPDSGATSTTAENPEPAPASDPEPGPDQVPEPEPNPDLPSEPSGTSSPSDSSSGGTGGSAATGGSSGSHAVDPSGGSGGTPINQREYWLDHYGTDDLRDLLGFRTTGVDWYASIPRSPALMHEPGDSLVVHEPRQAEWGDAVLPCFRAEGDSGDKVVREPGGTHYLTIVASNMEPVEADGYTIGAGLEWEAIAFRVEGLRDGQRLVAQIGYQEWQGEVNEYTFIDSRIENADEMFVDYEPVMGPVPTNQRTFGVLNLFVLGRGPFDFCVTELFTRYFF